LRHWYSMCVTGPAEEFSVSQQLMKISFIR
jgi:hypothetical protein